MTTKVTVAEALARIPGPPSAKWPGGERFAVVLRHGSMLVEYYAPRGADPQTPHEQDELYFVERGTGEFVIAGERHAVQAGDCLFAAAGVAHRFENFSADFGAWVVFWGPKGGERG